MSRNPQHKSRAITYISPAAREAAEKLQTLVIQGKGKMGRRTPVTTTPFSIDTVHAGSFDEEQAKKNKLLGYW